MKILHINTYDKSGGAARAVFRLHEALNYTSIDSKMIVQNKTSQIFSIIESCGRFGKVTNRLRPYFDLFFTRKKNPKSLFSTATLPSLQLVKQINKLEPDIVHLHWINNGMLRIEDIPKIKAPIVWSLHDNWAYTGGCHIINKCERYKYGCGTCPVINSKVDNDTSRRVFQRKLKSYSAVKTLSVISLSKWMRGQLKNSPLFANRSISVLPNTLNTDVFKPINKSVARNVLNIVTDKKLILFGALSSTSDPNKGFQQLKKALSNIRTLGVEFVVFGNENVFKGEIEGIKTHYLGRFFDDISLSLIYSACDIMAVPSSEEAFGQTALEALACGTPVVAFGHTGLLEIVEHKTSGYLAKPEDVIDFARGIDWILSETNGVNLEINARKRAISKFSYEVVAPMYEALYKNLINR